MLTGVLVFPLIMISPLAIPVTLTFQMLWPIAFQQDALLKWAFGLVTLRIPGSAPKALSSGGDESKRKTHRSKQTSRKKTNVLAAIWQKPFRRRSIRFISDLWRAVHKKDLSLRVRVDLGDPADTGHPGTRWRSFGLGSNMAQLGTNTT
jgi:hypothetical protein